MADYSWQLGDPIESKEIPVSERPGRIALTAPQCIVTTDRKLLLIDPHPEGTWMNWMFPYASLIVDSPKRPTSGFDPWKMIESKDLTLADLASILRRTKDEFAAEYEKAIHDEINNILPGISEGWQTVPFATNFSLKFSKTSQSYTAYLFDYYRQTQDSLVVSVPHIWVPIDNAEKFLENADNRGGRDVSSNVRDILPKLQ